MEQNEMKIGNWNITIIHHPDGFGWAATDFNEVIGSGLTRYKTNTQAQNAAMEAVKTKTGDSKPE